MWDVAYNVQKSENENSHSATSAPLFTFLYIVCRIPHLYALNKIPTHSSMKNMIFSRESLQALPQATLCSLRSHLRTRFARKFGGDSFNRLEVTHLQSRCGPQPPRSE